MEQEVSMQKKAFLLVLVLALLGLATVTVAQTGDGFALSWATIDGGGGSSAGGNFALAAPLASPMLAPWLAMPLASAAAGATRGRGATQPTTTPTSFAPAAGCGESANSQQLGAFNFGIVTGSP
jgi:hypothetical protein